MNIRDIDNVFLNQDFLVLLLGLLNQFDLIDDISLRNALIKKEWVECKQKGEELNKDFIERMADKYFLSTNAVTKILYSSRGRNQKTYLPVIRDINSKVLSEMIQEDKGIYETK